MELDKNEQYLATGDVNGNLRVWNISDYCKNIHVSNENAHKNQPRKKQTAFDIRLKTKIFT